MINNIESVTLPYHLDNIKKISYENLVLPSTKFITSDSVSNLLKSFIQYQSEITDVEKKSLGHGYKYAELGDFLNILRPSLAKYDLVIIQSTYNNYENKQGVVEIDPIHKLFDSLLPELLTKEYLDKILIEKHYKDRLIPNYNERHNKDCYVGVSTRLYHLSGEWIESNLDIRVDYSKGMSHAQSVGAAITYIRKYSLSTLGLLTQIDEDGATPKTKPSNNISDETLMSIIKMVEELKIPDQTINKWLTKYKVSSLSQLSPESGKSLHDSLMEKINQSQGTKNV